MKVKKRRATTIAAVALALALAIGGGTYAYLYSSTDDVTNEFSTNNVTVTLQETTGENYNIVPGTSQDKDPTVRVVNSIDAYAFVEVTDKTHGLVTYEIEQGWNELDGYDNIYYREVAANADSKVFSVLAGDKVSYSAGLENGDMENANNVKLTFKAYAIQKEPFNNPALAYASLNPEFADQGTFKTQLSDGGSIVLTGGIESEDGIQFTVTEDTSLNFNGNTLTGAIESGSISSSNPPVNLVLSDTNNDGSYSIDGKLVEHEGGGMTQIAAITAWKPTVTIESGKYTHDNAVILSQLQVQDSEAVAVVVNGGTFDGKGAARVIANVFGNVIVNDGEFNAHYDGENSGECVYVSSGNSHVPSITTINDGTFNADKRVFYVKVNTGYTQKIIVNGGTFNVGEGGELIQVSSGNPADYLTITGGTFNVDPTAYVNTASYKVEHSGSTWTVTAK